MKTEKISNLYRLPEKRRSVLKYLLDNPLIGREPIGKVVMGGEELDVTSNCIGTVACYFSLKYESMNLVCGDDVPFCLPAKKRPGYLDASVFEEMFSKKFEKIKRPAPGDLILINKKSDDELKFPGSDIVHAAIYLSSSFGGSKVFHQYGHGEIFSIMNLSLKDSKKDDLYFHFYRRR